MRRTITPFVCLLCLSVLWSCAGSNPMPLLSTQNDDPGWRYIGAESAIIGGFGTFQNVAGNSYYDNYSEFDFQTSIKRGKLYSYKGSIENIKGLIAKANVELAADDKQKVTASLNSTLENLEKLGETAVISELFLSKKNEIIDNYWKHTPEKSSFVKYVKNVKDQARVITKVRVAMDAKLYEEVKDIKEFSLGADTSYNIVSALLKAAGKSESKTEKEFLEPVVVAYQYSRLCFPTNNFGLAMILTDTPYKDQETCEKKNLRSTPKFD